MTIVKKLLVFLMLLPATVAAQDFKVRVSAGGEPVGYAYVIINGNFQAMTNAEGTARIPATRLNAGDMLSARFVGMESVAVEWDGNAEPGAVIELELIPGEIDKVVVTARSKDRSKQYFRRHVERIATHGWYTGFKGEYDVKHNGDRSWTARGKYEREHVPGDDVGSLDANTFRLRHTPGSDSTLMWQVQRYLLTVKGIAERAVQFDGGESNRGMIMKYRGRVDGRNVFLIIKPYFDKYSGLGDSFQALIHVSETSGVVYSSETISQNRYGIWNVAAVYATYSPTGKSADRFIYPTRLTARFEERSMLADLDYEPVTVDVALDNITAYHFTPGAVAQTNKP